MNYERCSIKDPMKLDAPVQSLIKQLNKLIF
jgi:hypothetical protein